MEAREKEERDRKDQTLGLLTLLDLLLLTDWIESEFLFVKRYLVPTCCSSVMIKKLPLPMRAEEESFSGIFICLR